MNDINPTSLHLTVAASLGFLLFACTSKEERQKLIHHAAQTGDSAEVQKWLDKDASLANHKEAQLDQTPLHEAANESVAKMLIDKGADVNAVDLRKNTTLHTAKNGAIVDLLISKGISVDVKNGDGRTSLFTAANGDVVRALVKHGADIYMPTAPVWPYATPLYYAVQDNRIETVQALLDLGADATPVDQKKMTLLHEAAGRGYLEIATLLIDKGAWVDATDTVNATPLHYAVLNDHVAIADLLLNRGANPHAQLSANAATINYQEASGRIGVPPPSQGRWGEKAAGGNTPIKLAKSDAMKTRLKQSGAIE